jgi:membrane protease YdiL (CAAX protease family)
MELDDPATSSTAMATFLEDLKTLPVYLVGAFVLTLAYDANGNIATSILTHAFYNASQVLLMFISMYLLEDLINSSSVIETFTNLFEYIKLLI